MAVPSSFPRARIAPAHTAGFRQAYAFDFLTPFNHTTSSSSSSVLQHLHLVLSYHVSLLNAHDTFMSCVQCSFLIDTTTRLSSTQISRCSCSSFRSFTDEDQECCHWRIASKSRVVLRRKTSSRLKARNQEIVSMLRPGMAAGFIGRKLARDS